MTIVGSIAVGVLYAAGTYLLLQRSLVRIIIGLSLIAHGANLLLLLSGSNRGLAPIVGAGAPEELADPMPQALALTAIVISFGVLVYLLAVSFASWRARGDDVVEDQFGDRRLAQLAEEDRIAEEQR